MSYATKPLSNRIAVVFDFEERPTASKGSKVMLSHDDGTYVPFGERRKTKGQSPHVRASRDETLIPDDSFKALLRDCQLDVEAFERDRVNPLIEQGWHKYLARTYCLAQESRHRESKDKITYERLANL